MVLRIGTPGNVRIGDTSARVGGTEAVLGSADPPSPVTIQAAKWETDLAVPFEGAGGTISAPDTDGVQTIDLTWEFFSDAQNDSRLILTGSAFGSNNGDFRIIGASPDQVRYYNPAGVAEPVFVGYWCSRRAPVTPTKGPTGGRTIVEILGTGFRLPVLPPPTGFVGGDPEISVQVIIGGRRAVNVQVVSPERLFATTQSRDPGLFEVVVRNIDSNGDPIPGEEARIDDAYMYARPRLDALAESDTVRLCRTLIRELQRQIHPNVAITTATDYDSDTADLSNFVEIAELPQLILIGPEFAENRFYTNNEPIEEDPDTITAELGIRRFPRVVDVNFSLIGATDNMTELLNLLHVIQSFFNRNKDLSILRNAPAGDPNQAWPVDPDPEDLVTYELDIQPGQQFGVTNTPNNSNLRTLSGAFLIRGFEIEDLPDFPADLLEARTREVLQTDLCPTIEQFGTVFRIGKSPGDSTFGGS